MEENLIPVPYHLESSLTQATFLDDLQDYYEHLYLRQIQDVDSNKQ